MPYADSGVRIVIFYDRVDPLLRGHHDRSDHVWRPHGAARIGGAIGVSYSRAEGQPR